MDISPQIYTHVEQIFLYKAGLSLNNDVAVPFFKSENTAKNMFFYSGLTLAWYRWPIRSPHRFSLTAHLIPLEPLGTGGLANVPHKCALITFFGKVNYISNLWTSFLTDAPTVIYCLAMYPWIYTCISRFFNKKTRLDNEITVISFEFNHRLYTL